MQQNNASLLTRFLESLIPGNSVLDDYTRVCPVSSGRGSGYANQFPSLSALRAEKPQSTSVTNFLKPVQYISLTPYHPRMSEPL